MRTWGISSIFGSRGSSGERLARSRSLGEPDHSDQMPSRIQLTEVIIWPYSVLVLRIYVVIHLVYISVIF